MKGLSDLTGGLCGHQQDWEEVEGVDAVAALRPAIFLPTRTPGLSSPTPDVTAADRSLNCPGRAEGQSQITFW